MQEKLEPMTPERRFDFKQQKKLDDQAPSDLAPGKTTTP